MLYLLELLIYIIYYIVIICDCQWLEIWQKRVWYYHSLLWQNTTLFWRKYVVGSWWEQSPFNYATLWLYSKPSLLSLSFRHPHPHKQTLADDFIQSDLSFTEVVLFLNSCIPEESNDQGRPQGGATGAITCTLSLKKMNKLYKTVACSSNKLNM